MVNGERIRERLAALDMSGAELARRTGITQPSISNLITGTSRKTTHILEIARELDTTPEYLTGETDDPRRPVLDINTNDADNAPPSKESLGRMASNLVDVLSSREMVTIREIDLSFGMGMTFLDVPVTEEMHSFPRAWIRRYSRAAADQLFFAKGLGDSMEPTLFDSDLLLIDTSQKTLNMSDKIWAIAYANCGMIKRLRPVPSGGVEIWSDNKSLSTITAYDGEMEIIGRVVAVQRKL